MWLAIELYMCKKTGTGGNFSQKRILFRANTNFLELFTLKSKSKEGYRDGFKLQRGRNKEWLLSKATHDTLSLHVAINI